MFKFSILLINLLLEIVFLNILYINKYILQLIIKYICRMLFLNMIYYLKIIKIYKVFFYNQQYFYIFIRLSNIDIIYLLGINYSNKF